MLISSVSSATTTSAGSTESSSSLGKDDFLQLLITQMQYQDPLDPMDNTEYVAQLAQFSTLEQMENMSSCIEFQQATAMIGENVKLEITADDGSTELVYGEVTSVSQISGEMYVTLSNGSQYAVSEVDSVLSDSGIYQEALNMVGKDVYVRQYNSSGEVTGVAKATIQEVVTDSGYIQLKTTDGDLIEMGDIYNVITESSSI